MKMRTFIIAGIAVVAAGIAHAQTPAVSDCPDDYRAFDESSPPLTCTCSAEATQRGSLYGMDVYPGVSSVCKAATHAGVISKAGGQVTVISEAGRKAYPGVTRSGVQSGNWSAYKNSFRFAAAGQSPGAGATASPTPAATTMSDCPDDYRAFDETSAPLTCTCSAAATQRGSLYGMDVYPGLSSVCKAAMHAAVIGKAGGQVTVISEAGRKAYPGVTRNSVQSGNWNAYKNSFRFSAAGAASAPGAPSALPAATMMSDCPDDYRAFDETSAPLTCTCSAEAMQRGSLYGMDVYPGISSVCKAAMHAGVLPRTGGQVTVISGAGRNAYPGVTRNGVQSGNWSAYKNSFRFAAAAAASKPAAAPSATPAPTTMSDCPDDYRAFDDASPPLTCTCSAEATQRGSLYGMDVYPGISSVCKAAVHAAVIAKSGGQVTVISEAGRKAYPGVTRNGVQSGNWNEYKNSFRFQPPARAAVEGNKPVQQPIAATIQATGQVALYVQFRFNSADLDVDSAATLMELRDALKATPNLRLMLIGHTDSVGTPPYNRTLSLRRAQSVMNWLVTQGIAPARLAVDGKGMEQPIADNNTDAGRTLNRRVQAVRIR